MINYIIVFVFGVAVGVFLSRKFNSNKDLTTDDCMDILHHKGYYVKLSKKDNVRH